MRLGQHAIALIERMWRADTSTALADILKASFAPHGVTSLLVTGLPEPPGRFEDHFLINGSHSGWRRHYAHEEFYGVDPVAIVLRKSRAPFQWSIGWYEELNEPSKNPRSAQVLRDAAEFRLNAGYAVPIVQSLGFQAAAYFSGARLDTDPRFWRVMHLAGLYAHARACELRKHDSFGSHGSILLTDREREILRWTAVGKTSWEISVLLGVSENAVNRCICSAVGKLDAVNRTQAVVNAIRLGEIEL